MTAQPGERTVSWLDEDDPNRGAKPFVPVESVIELTPSEAEPPPKKKSRREKAPRLKLWRRDKAAPQERPERENPPRDMTPRSEEWPAPASEDWLTNLRGPASRAPRDAEPPPAPDDDGWTTRPPLAAAPPPEDWFTRGDAPPGGDRSGAPEGGDWAVTPERDQPRGDWTGAPDRDQPRGDWAAAPARARPGTGAAVEWDQAPAADGRPEWATSDERPEWVTGPEPTPRPEWDTASARPDWDNGPEPAARPGWDDSPEPATRPGRDDSPEPAARPGWDNGPGRPGRDNGPEPDWDSTPEPTRRLDWDTSAEKKARPDWVTSPVPPAPAAAPDGNWSAPDGNWSAPGGGDAPVPEAFPAPLDITPDDDLAEPPTKRQRRGPRPPSRTDGGGGRPPRRGRFRRKPLIMLAVALTAAVVGAAVVAAGTAYRLVLFGGTPGSHTIAAPLGGRTQAELELASGAAKVTVSGADLGDDLFQVTTPDDDEALPRAVINGNRTTVRLTSNSGEGATAVEVRLNAKVTWRLVLAGGARTQTVDFSAGRLAGLEMGGGATRLELTLPKPAGTVPIRLRGGLDELLMHAPQGVHTRVKITKGATNVTLDRLKRSKVAPDTTFTPNGWERSKTRYDVDAAEGIGTVKLDRR